MSYLFKKKTTTKTTFQPTPKILMNKLYYAVLRQFMKTKKCTCTNNIDTWMYNVITVKMQ